MTRMFFRYIIVFFLLSCPIGGFPIHAKFKIRGIQDIFPTPFSDQLGLVLRGGEFQFWNTTSSYRSSTNLFRVPRYKEKIRTNTRQTFLMNTIDSNGRSDLEVRKSDGSSVKIPFSEKIVWLDFQGSSLNDDFHIMTFRGVYHVWTFHAEQKTYLPNIDPIRIPMDSQDDLVTACFRMEEYLFCGFLNGNIGYLDLNTHKFFQLSSDQLTSPIRCILFYSLSGIHYRLVVGDHVGNVFLFSVKIMEKPSVQNYRLLKLSGPSPVVMIQELRSGLCVQQENSCVTLIRSTQLDQKMSLYTNQDIGSMALVHDNKLFFVQNGYLECLQLTD